MITITKTVAVTCAALLALLGSATQVSLAAGIGFKNDLRTLQPIIVQGATVAADMVRRGPPLLIFPGRMGWDNRLDPGVRLIVIYDANQPTRILYRRPIEFQGQDVFFSIQYDNFGNILLVPVPIPLTP